MFTHHGTQLTELLTRLFAELKDYLQLQKRYVAMDAADKLTVILSAVAVAAVCLIVGAMSLLFAMFALAYFIGEQTNSPALGFAVVAAALLLGLIVFYIKRTAWVIQPIARLMLHLFADNQDDTDHEE